MPKLQEHKPSIFAKRLVELRKSRQLTQVQLAEKIGVSKATIGYYESAAKNPKLDTIFKLAEFFGVPPEELITENLPNAKPGPESKIDQQVKRIKSLSPAKQRMIVSIVEAALNAE